jgi:hypothetical protein
MSRLRYFSGLKKIIPELNKQVAAPTCDNYLVFVLFMLPFLLFLIAWAKQQQWYFGVGAALTNLAGKRWGTLALVQKHVYE